MDERQELVRTSLPTRTKRAVELATEKGASNWRTVIPIKDLNFNLNKREFRDAIKLRYDWEIIDTRGGFTIQRHNELHDLEAEMVITVCNDVEIEQVLQEINGESLNRGASRAPDARSDISARGFWERQRTEDCILRCHGLSP